MKNVVAIALVGFAIVLATNSEAYAQRGRGGGGGRSGGGFSGASRSMGSSPSMSRTASPSINRPSPSQSVYRPSPSMNRPSPSASRPSEMSPQNRSGQAGNFGGTSRPGSASGNQSFRSQPSYQKPSQQSVGNFLNLPQKTGASSFSSGGSPPTASQQPTGPKSFTTAGGATITYGGRSGGGTTASGAQVGGAVGGIKVETEGGQTFGKVGGVGVATDGTNSAVRGGSITGATDGQGNSAANVRGGYADSSGYRQGGSVTATQNQYGYTRVGVTAGYGYGNGTGQVASAVAVRGPGGNVVSGGYGSSHVNGQFVGGQSWNAVNGNFTRRNAFGPGYVNAYPNCWWPGKWAVATTAWATASYVVAGSYCGCSSEAVSYNYGDNVTYEDGTVSQDGQPVATAEEYYDQAGQIADSGQEATNEEWMPLGVFALIVEGQTQPDKLVQLALNKEGIIRGNYQDMLADSVIPVTGAVAKETQRVALKLTGNEELVVETGLYNLTNDEVSILVHFDANRQETRKLIRLDRPADAPPAE
jgi:hypothetical protein